MKITDEKIERTFLEFERGLALEKIILERSENSLEKENLEASKKRIEIELNKMMNLNGEKITFEQYFKTQEAITNYTTWIELYSKKYEIPTPN